MEGMPEVDRGLLGKLARAAFSSFGTGASKNFPRLKSSQGWSLAADAEFLQALWYNYPEAPM